MDQELNVEGVAPVDTGPDDGPNVEKLEDTVWLFQANPDHFDIQGYLAAGLERITWSAKRNRARMREGQRVFIWQAMGSKTDTKKRSGVVATAVIDEGPWFGPDHRPAHRFWAKKAKAKEAQWHVWLRDVEVASPKHVVKRDWVKEDPVCGDLLALNQRTGTNYTVPEHHAGRLAHLWRRAGRPWMRQDLLAALWTYCELGGPPTAGDVERLGQLAVLIGRGVGPTREALYKFAKLDPQVNKGRDGSRAYDAMWEEFYDSTLGNLDRARLERAYREAWTVGHIPISGRRWEPNQVRIEEVAIEAMVAETFPRREKAVKQHRRQITDEAQSHFNVMEQARSKAFTVGNCFNNRLAGFPHLKPLKTRADNQYFGTVSRMRGLRGRMIHDIRDALPAVVAGFEEAQRLYQNGLNQTKRS